MITTAIQTNMLPKQAVYTTLYTENVIYNPNSYPRTIIIIIIHDRCKKGLKHKTRSHKPLVFHEQLNPESCL